MSVHDIPIQVVEKCIDTTINTSKIKKKTNYAWKQYIGDKFSMSIRRGKVTISLCKKLISCINCPQLLI